jgi:hypothetical protein
MVFADPAWSDCRRCRNGPRKLDRRFLDLDTLPQRRTLTQGPVDRNLAGRNPLHDVMNGPLMVQRRRRPPSAPRVHSAMDRYAFEWGRNRSMCF